MITRTERTELRSIVRQQFKVLRAELEQRKVEMFASIEDDIAARFHEDDQNWAALSHEVHEAVMEANRRINDALHNAGYQARGNYEKVWIHTPPMQQPRQERQELRSHTHRRIEAQVQAARLRLDREEADLLRTLATSAIESEEARSFLEGIPTVGELVPAARLAELQEGLSGESQQEGP